MDSGPTGITIRPDRRDYTVRWIFDEDGVEVPVAYTVGHTSLPSRPYELACTGLPARHSLVVLNNTIDQLTEEGRAPADGMEIDQVLDRLTVRLRPVADTSGFTAMRERYGHQPPVWQVLVPDKWGLFPGDTHYSEPLDAQPLL